MAETACGSKLPKGAVGPHWRGDPQHEPVRIVEFSGEYDTFRIAFGRISWKKSIFIWNIPWIFELYFKILKIFQHVWLKIACLNWNHLPAEWPVAKNNHSPSPDPSGSLRWSWLTPGGMFRKITPCCLYHLAIFDSSPWTITMLLIGLNR